MESSFFSLLFFSFSRYISSRKIRNVAEESEIDRDHDHDHGDRRDSFSKFTSFR